jgi:hypothetical protein
MNKNWVLMINGFAGGWLLGKSGFGIDCIIAYFILGFTILWYDRRVKEQE